MSLEVSIKKKLGDFNLDINFITDMETLALFGESGCGKSMTLKCIAGIEKPDQGKIVLNGRVLFDSEKKINLPPQKRKVGYLFQQYALFPHMTVFKNIASAITNCQINKKELVEEKIRTFYLEGLENKYPWELSGGQKQRVALARIFASDPEVLLLDEPFSALDSYLKWQLEQELMSTLENCPCNSIFVSHNREEVYRLCENVSVISKGKNEEPIAVKELFKNPKSLSAALLTGCKNYSNIEKVSSNEVMALDWGEKLTINKEVKEVDKYIGIRAHHILLTDEIDENTIKCRVVKSIEEVFTTIVLLKPIKSNFDSDYSKIRIEVTKDTWENIKSKSEVFIRINIEDIMLLS